MLPAKQACKLAKPSRTCSLSGELKDNKLDVISILIVFTNFGRLSSTKLVAVLLAKQAIDSKPFEGGDPAAPSSTATLLRLHPSH
jgi:hypothetical protein